MATLVEVRMRSPADIVFREELTRLGFRLVEEMGDGSCLVRCVAHAAMGNPELHARLRARCVRAATNEMWSTLHSMN